MQSTQNKEVIKSPVPERWERVEDVFTGDQLIDAYFKGIEKGKNEHIRILTKQFQTNLEKATELSEKLFKEIAKLKFHPQEVHLKADEITKFKALIIVSKADFISDTFNKAYSISRKLMRESENDEFYITFSFTPASDKLSEHCLISDGFFMKYDPKHRPA